MTRLRLSALVMLLLLYTACRAPRVAPLTGVPASVALPHTSLPPGHQTIVFRWAFSDRIFSANGDGAARVAAPDSVRLDFFSDRGEGLGFAIVLGDSIYTPGGDQARRYLPPVPLLWAAFGTLRLVGADTILRVDGDTLRADIVSDTLAQPNSLPATFWRVAFAGRDLVRLERVSDRRLEEFVERRDSVSVRYRHNGARRSLGLTLQRRTRGEQFDPTIWQH
ncbi:MAG: hypothetical protein ACREOG_06890 [Gemmatimonadaceae bacterium]